MQLLLLLCAAFRDARPRTAAQLAAGGGLQPPRCQSAMAASFGGEISGVPIVYIVVGSMALVGFILMSAVTPPAPRAACPSLQPVPSRVLTLCDDLAAGAV
jgi:hypothetical protein